MSEKGGDLNDVKVSHWEVIALYNYETKPVSYYRQLQLQFKLLSPFFFVPLCCTQIPGHLSIWVTLVSFILNEYMITSKYAENVLVIIRQDYGIF